MLQTLKIRFESLTRREQWMIAICGWVCVLSVGIFNFIEPAYQQLVVKEQQHRAMSVNINELMSLNDQQLKMLSDNPDSQLDRELTEQQEKNLQLAQEIQKQVAGYVNSSQMSSLMESVLKQSDKLELVSMRSLPSALLTKDKDAGYHLHPIEMTLRGSFFDIVEYLTALESLPVKYFWRKVDYRVVDYPTAEVVIEVYTLGDSPLFIGG
ncbi:type II secretion system protein M [Veronia nyctiphanis]|nr:type II secretion system protein M [Veronia nyctiphanis]